MSYKVEAVTKSLALGEGPHWDIETQTLYFVDIEGGSIHSYKPATNKHSSAVIGKGDLPVSLILPIEKQKGKYLISVKNDILSIEWDGDSSKTSTPQVIASFEPKDKTTRINDGKADPKGRLWAGTMGPIIGDKEKLVEPQAGSLYTLFNGKEVKKQAEKITISNGLAWSLDNKKLYFIDSLKLRVDSYDYDIEKGTISNEKIVFDLRKNNISGFPDGMTIDSEGKLFVANFGGSQVLRIDPEVGSLISKIPIPAPQVTSVAFGGPNLDELYVTTANLNEDTHRPETSPKDPKAGCLFKVTNLGVKGLPAVNVAL